MKNNKNVPEMRFEGFTETWEQRKLGEVGITQSGIGFPDAEQGGKEGIPFFKVSDMNIIGNEFEMQSANNYVSKEQIERKNWKPITSVPAIMFAKVGAAIMLNRKRLIRHPFLIDNNTMAYIFDKTWDINFGKIIFDTIYLPKYSQVGALPSYNGSDIENINVLMPNSLPEQKAIGDFFSTLDRSIALHQCKYEKLLDLKKSMMYKLFPKEGETTPEIRFDGFNGEWEKKKLGDCFSERTESFPDGELLSVTINQGIKKFSELNRKNNSNENKTKYKKVYVGDIAYNSMRMWQGASGYSPFEGIVSPAYTVLNPKEGIDSKCFAYLFKRTDIIHMFQLYSKGITSDNWNLKYPDFKELEVYVSCDYNEQKVIGEYFSELDKLIELNREKLGKLKNIKSSLLDKMFV